MVRNSQGNLLIKGWTLKEITSVLFLLSAGVGIVGNSLYQNHLEDVKKEIRIAQLADEVESYKTRLQTCTKVNEVFPMFYSNNPRSQQRIEQVLESFDKVIDSNCFIVQESKISTNPYKQIELTRLDEGARTSSEEEIFQGILYEVDKGIPFLVTGGSICADGSYSGSVGRGTCSWHGGYASHRGTRFDFNQSIYEYDPRVDLRLLRKE